MSSILELIKNKLSLAKNSILPAFIFAFTMLSFYIMESFEDQTTTILHILFYISGLSIISALLYFNQNKPLFFALIIICAYTLINSFKKSFGAEYEGSAAYTVLCFLTPLNLLFFFLTSKESLLNKKSIYIILALFIELSLAERLSQAMVITKYQADIHILNILLFTLMNICLFIKTSLKGSVETTFLFFAGLSISLGFYYSASPSALTAFFTSAMIMIIISVAKSIYYETYRDLLTGFSSRKSFIINAKSLPLKYSIGLISIDNYDKLLAVFGSNGTNNLVKMISMKMAETEPETQIYRYSEEEFIIIFNNEGKDAAFAKLDSIRKSIAASEFVLNRRKKNLKLTISGSITEKKRSDAGAIEVLQRAKKALQNTNHFAQNFTSKA